MLTRVKKRVVLAGWVGARAVFNLNKKAPARRDDATQQQQQQVSRPARVQIHAPSRTRVMTSDFTVRWSVFKQLRTNARACVCNEYSVASAEHQRSFFPILLMP